MRAEVYLALGSNLGDRAANIEKGLQQLERLSTSVLVSSLYETAPHGFSRQPAFLNAVCRLWTSTGPFALMDAIRGIEHDVGRSRSFPNAPRTLDIDLLLYGRTVLDSPGLTIPHPRMAERAFVLQPLGEIAPALQHPVLRRTIRSVLLAVSTGGNAVRKFRTATEVGQPG